ncbi:pentapeptide repeat-containing protein [Nocardia spumae]|uniref:pentapeptide repeat-containing protein n=1 Tax=Nocardia spumae TaxID=2887190 RepID=UPI001D14A0B8|nr:pentapeptide repeat-containing protein [Nocardia spumae]
MAVLVQPRSVPASAADNILIDKADPADFFRRNRFRYLRQHTDERFVSAAATLYVGEWTAQLSAIRTLAHIADVSAPAPRQRCIDILCGYLRLPRRPGLIDLHDRAVRRAIVTVIADRVRRGARRSWSRATFDFRGAHLEDADFTAAVFRGPVVFEHATLAGTTRFDSAIFGSEIHFQMAAFDTAWFRDAQFADSARFFGARFHSARFDGATFRVAAQFPLTVFSDYAGFRRTAFRGPAYFDSARFHGATDFSAARFTVPVHFDGATFTMSSRQACRAG